MTVLVTGAEGQLGCAIAETFEAGHRVVAKGREALDLTCYAAVVDAVRVSQPDVIINCAAYNDVDGAETDPVAAFDVNAFATRSLAEVARSVDATLVHYSTDFVFDGEADEPYTEDAAANPQSVYAMSKLVGEWFAGDTRSYVLRVESLFGGHGRDTHGSSLDRMAHAILDGKTVHAFSDRVVSPSYVPDVADATIALLRVRPAHGLYHCVGSGSGTWLEVVTELARCLGRSADIIPIRMADRPLKAKRPAFCALSNAKLADAGITMPAWQEAVRRYAEALLNSAH